MKKIIKLLGFFILLALFACAGKKDKDKIPTVEESYTEAMKLLKEKNYSQAAEKFEKVNNDYPLSYCSSKAQVMAAYAFYKDKKYDDVVRTADEFITSSPSNPDIAYMQYLKALSYYDLIPDIERAQDKTQLASYGFRELIARFPNSQYAIDAKEKLIIVDEHLAGAKMAVGRNQIASQNYVGAIDNFTEVTERYKNTNQVPEAYFRLFEIYYKLGINNQAKYFASELKKNYPQNQWTKRLDNYFK